MCKLNIWVLYDPVSEMVGIVTTTKSTRHIIILFFDVDINHLNRTILLTFYFWWCTGQLYRDDVWTWWRCALFDFQTNRTTMRYARSAQNEFVGMCRNCSSRKQIPSYVKPSVDSQIKTCEPNETTADLVSTTTGPGNYSSPLSNKHIKKQPHREEILDNGIMEIRNVFGLCKGWLGRGSPGGNGANSLTCKHRLNSRDSVTLIFKTILIILLYCDNTRHF